MNEVNPGPTMNVENEESQRSVNLENEKSVQCDSLVGEKERSKALELKRGSKCVETCKAERYAEWPPEAPYPPLKVKANEDPMRVRLRCLKARLGRNLQQGYVTERTKASIRINAIRFPHIFGSFKV